MAPRLVKDLIVLPWWRVPLQSLWDFLTFCSHGCSVTYYCSRRTPKLGVLKEDLIIFGDFVGTADLVTVLQLALTGFPSVNGGGTGQEGPGGFLHLLGVLAGMMGKQDQCGQDTCVWSLQHHSPALWSPSE